MQPAMQTAFGGLGTLDLLNQDFMKKPILMPQSIHAVHKKKEIEPLLSELL
jgi:hypothetical protein